MRDEPEEVRTLLDALRAGDEQALGPLFDIYRHRLRRMVEFRMDARLRGRVSPSDVLQEAYIDALKRLAHFRADRDVPIFVWLRTVTSQRLVDAYRQHLGAQARDVNREIRLAPGGEPEASLDRMADLMGDVTSPSVAAQRIEIVARVREALDGLDPIDREVLALRHFEELSNREVAAVLGIATAAASKRYVRAIERLQGVLEQFSGLGGGAG